MIKRFTLMFMAAVCCLMSHAAVSTIDDLVGNYSSTAEGTQYFSGAWADMPTGHVVSITKATNDSISIYNLMGYGETLTAAVDFDAKTVNAEVLTGFKTWYSLAGEKDNTKGIVGNIQDDGSIVFDDYSAWYGSYEYVYYAKNTITKFTKDWTVTGDLKYYGSTDTTGDPMHSAQTTLTKYVAGENAIYGLKMDGTYASPEELVFTVTGDSIGIVNGEQTAGYAGAYLYYCYDGVYDIWFDTSAGCSYFAPSNSQTAGTLYLYHYDYVYTGAELCEGTVTFTWSPSTGVAAVKAEEAAKNAPIYDMMGRRVSAASAHGVYIQNGKKFAK